MSFLVESDVIRLVLGFLDERHRLRFLATSKIFAPWLQKRRDVASNALAQLQARGALWVRTRMLPDSNNIVFHNFTIQRCLDDAGLLLLRTSWHSTMPDGTSNHYAYTYHHYAPWAFALVCIDRPEADRRIDENDDKSATLRAVSARVF